MVEKQEGRGEIALDNPKPPPYSFGVIGFIGPLATKH
jgi:hypothetical protein